MVQSFFCVLFFSLCSNLSIWPGRQVVPDGSRCYIPIFDGLVYLCFIFVLLVIYREIEILLDKPHYNFLVKRKQFCCLNITTRTDYHRTKVARLLRSWLRIPVRLHKLSIFCPTWGMLNISVLTSSWYFSCAVTNLDKRMLWLHFYCAIGQNPFIFCIRKCFHQSMLFSPVGSGSIW